MNVSLNAIFFHGCIYFCTHAFIYFMFLEIRDISLGHANTKYKEVDRQFVARRRYQQGDKKKPDSQTITLRDMGPNRQKSTRMPASH